MRIHGRGYTLIELLTALCIAVLLVKFSLPGFSNLLTRNTNNIAMQTALSALDRARSMSVMSGKHVGVCIFARDQSCSADWSGDYLAVFVDVNKNRQRDRDEEIIYQQSWPAKTLQLSWSGNWRNEPIITYQPNGSVVSNGTLSFVDKKGKTVQALIISKPGRVRIAPTP